jgi:hypothetical protein
MQIFGAAIDGESFPKYAPSNDEPMSHPRAVGQAEVYFDRASGEQQFGSNHRPQ